MINVKKLETSMDYLAMTDEVYAGCKTNMIRLDKQEKTILARELLISTRKTQGMKEAEARISSAYSQWHSDYCDAVYEFELVKNKRISASLVIEVWRSEFSARKQGIVL